MEKDKIYSHLKFFCYLLSVHHPLMYLILHPTYVCEVCVYNLGDEKETQVKLKEI